MARDTVAVWAPRARSHEAAALHPWEPPREPHTTRTTLFNVFVVLSRPPVALLSRGADGSYALWVAQPHLTSPLPRRRLVGAGVEQVGVEPCEPLQ